MVKPINKKYKDQQDEQERTLLFAKIFLKEQDDILALYSKLSNPMLKQRITETPETLVKKYFEYKYNTRLPDTNIALINTGKIKEWLDS